MKTKKKKASSKAVKLKRLATKYRDEAEKLHLFKRRHDKVFTRLEKMEARLDELKLKITDIARENSTPGRTLTLVEEEHVSVSVTGPKPSKPDYDPALVRKYWPHDIVGKVLIVDSKKAFDQIKRAKLDEKLAKRAELPMKELTPRVSINVKFED